MIIVAVFVKILAKMGFATLYPASLHFICCPPVPAKSGQSVHFRTVDIFGFPL